VTGPEDAVPQAEVPDDGAPVVDARGTRCPVPVIRVARVARDLPAGARVVLLADDVAARSDVPAWGRMRGHAVDVSSTDDEGVTTYRVTVGGAAATST
jgi:tRNA 2-thiouridine synthesizing protein A